jgi:hypothetical protein
MTNRRRALIAVPLEAIATMLELPPGLQVHHLFPDSYRDAVCVAVTGDHLDEVPAGTETPLLAIRDDVQVIDTTPVLDALRQLHRQDGPVCSHCWTWDDDAGKPERATWPCATMKAAESEALLRPLVMRRIKVEVAQAVTVG